MLAHFVFITCLIIFYSQNGIKDDAMAVLVLIGSTLLCGLPSGESIHVSLRCGRNSQEQTIVGCRFRVQSNSPMNVRSEII